MFSEDKRRAAKVFYIEGNVGVGKTQCASSICKMLREKDVKPLLIEENVAEFASSCGALKGHLKREAQLRNVTAGEWDVVLVERHPTTTLEVFDESAETRELYDALHEMSGFLKNPENTIYIKNSPRACRDRARVRRRQGECDFDETLFEAWHGKLENMMTKRIALGGKVFIFDAFGGDAHQLSASIISCMGY